MQVSLPKVYLSVQQDAKYPFILITMNKATNLSKHDFATYEIDFEICIFTREKAQETLLKLAANISNLMRSETLSTEQFQVISVKDQNLDFVRGHDLLTTKLIISYKGLIQSK